MSDGLDAELERVKKLGQTPKVIRIGYRLYSELEREINPIYPADILTYGQKTSVTTPKEVTEYQGIRVEFVEDAEPDYLQIQT